LKSSPDLDGNTRVERGIVDMGAYDAPTCRVYGDLRSPFCVVDVADLGCVLQGFIDFAECPQADIAPCGGDGVLDVDELIAILAAFEGEYLCSPNDCP